MDGVARSRRGALPRCGVLRRTPQLAVCLVLLGASCKSKFAGGQATGADLRRSRLDAWRAQKKMPRPAGRWVLNPDRCRTLPDAYACLGDYWFELDGHGEGTISDPCALLHARGIKHLTFCGDSYIRGIYIGLLSLLSDNYRDAALMGPRYVDANHSGDTHLECHYDKQYSSRSCRKSIQREKKVCQGRLTVSHVSWRDGDNIRGLPWCIPWEGERAHAFDDANLIVWFGGNHPVSMDYSLMPGEHDAATVEEYILHRFCPTWSREQRAKLMWVSSHACLPQKIVEGLPLDHPLREVYPRFVARNVLNPSRSHDNARVQEYNAQMATALERVCNVSRVVDVFGMTADAITDVEDIQNFTYDGRHWSMAVNIVKAKILLAQIARADAGEFAGRIPSRPLSSCQSRSARPTCLRVLSPVPGEVLDHRQQTVYALPFVLQIRCRQHSSPPRSLHAIWGGSAFSFSCRETLGGTGWGCVEGSAEDGIDSGLDEMAAVSASTDEHADAGGATAVTVSLPGLRRGADNMLTWTLVREDASEDIATVFVDYHAWPHLAATPGYAGPRACPCAEGTECHVVRW